MVHWSCSKNHDDGDLVVPCAAAAVGDAVDAAEEGVGDAEEDAVVVAAAAVVVEVVVPQQMPLVEAGGSWQPEEADRDEEPTWYSCYGLVLPSKMQ